ncbi:agmatinase [Denitrobaculum tricleocarpae]|uniref:Agmatinase n=1 Tax=Denitrobaculum tricleocarpae TaxID=2591009 RepID=A0A545TAW6_9PROT|nr:agmatinase [Denitrobaculum tricleocarpae]TQV74360.1 agmatinase [Denitrobaculum tricleocarpae]
MSQSPDRPLPTFSARETFFGTDKTGDAAISIAGVPMDIATTNRAGARDGPAAVRRASRMAGGTYPDLWPDLYSLDFADVGNFSLMMGKLEESLALIERQALEHDHLISVGGDHLVTLPLLRAAAKKHGAPLGLVHFDAHVDTWDENYGVPVTHGTNFRIAINEGLVDPKRMIQIGIRCRVEPEVWQWTLDQGVTIITAEEVHMGNPADVAARIHQVVGNQDKTYLTFDIDCLDPSCAPGTGTPETGGLLAWQARSILTRLGGINFIGMDVVEVAPAYDVGEITALNGASVMAFYMGLLAASKSQAE